ncbi:hypothetical protein BVRB_015410 [Beta vulgaris subsp. vulgaris]|uniref:Uncharacterized protein n=1 Tax=Beta vulgaris subsp. vulgaris TaxID=3555 RepID=A0A0J8B192_BETVV|nr:uncharacterized protein LOC104885249 [Beta vulgaris subsp. vulgaris]KMS94774.1 hypothetical protein BVRB_015410 [Beta vulgaris subsp. vulgaris]
MKQDPRSFELHLEYINALPSGQETDFILVSCTVSGIKTSRKDHVLRAKKELQNHMILMELTLKSILATSQKDKEEILREIQSITTEEVIEDEVLRKLQNRLTLA